MTRYCFPDRRYASAGDYAGDYARQFAEALAAVDRAEIDGVAACLTAAIDAGREIFVCGNGGSSAIANHVTCDYVKLLGLATGKPVRLSSLNSYGELNFAIANDIAFEEVFSFHIAQRGRPGDVLWTISSSGSSANIVKALETASAKGLETIAFTGFSGGKAKELATHSLHVPAENYGLVEDAHQMLAHIVCQYVRHLHVEEETLGSVVF
ncbi:D-sedoheptulose 7-phosphate isomerase [Breoghania corrubedonensis]|uniref:D-sedoheptulose 7-phosphate isomerase n=1 Tax=Breoghania corrubedonensis TaxID=665038 RepID=A0A2T5UW38_9HYPH|nr:SIS domain-containing protein [Breoghania corrubedonensis]PTW55727.1 D-sedoheptulose 7-phosphate isomerase [Breoghania corrubedonensis]